MAINKITNEQRELMRQKSAQTLPDVPSSKGWTPKRFKDSITKPLFDNENSFFALINGIVDQMNQQQSNLDDTKFDKDDYDFKNLGQFESERAFATACESDYYNSQRESKNFAYKGYITSNGNQSTALCLVGYTSGSGMNFDTMVISHKGITCYKSGVEVATSIPKVEVSDLKVNMTTSVPYPSSSESIANKYYVDSNYYKKGEIDSSLQNIETNLNYNIQGALDSSKTYTDLKHSELKSLLDTLLKDAPTAYDTLKEIADYIASDKTGASEMLSKINNNTSEINVIKQGLPETLDIILRSEVSESTTEEVKEMEINGMKFKIGSGGGTSNQILTLSDIEYDFEDEDGLFNLYINTKLDNQNLLIDFAKEFPDYQYNEINEFNVILGESKNSQVLVKFNENYLSNLYDVAEQVSFHISYEYRLTSLDSNETFGKISSISTYEESSYITYELGMTEGTNIIKLDFDAFGNGTSYISYNMEI